MELELCTLVIAAATLWSLWRTIPPGFLSNEHRALVYYLGILSIGGIITKTIIRGLDAEPTPMSLLQSSAIAFGLTAWCIAIIWAWCRR